MISNQISFRSWLKRCGVQRGLPRMLLRSYSMGLLEETVFLVNRGSVTLLMFIDGLLRAVSVSVDEPADYGSL